MSRVWVGLLLALLGIFIAWRLSFLSKMPRAVTHLSIDAEVASPVAISPDGTTLAYTELYGDDVVLHLRGLHGPEVVRFAGTEGAAQPVFSPDGMRIAFESSGALMMISAGGGEPVKLAELPEITGMCWTDDATVVAGTKEGLVAVPKRQVTTLDAGESVHRYPAMLPGSRWVLFDQTSRIDAASLSTGERHTVVSDGTMPRYASTGHLLFAREQSLWAVPFDPDRAEPTGSPVLVFEGIGSWYDISNNGTFGFSRPGRRSQPTVVSIIINWHRELGRLVPMD